MRKVLRVLSYGSRKRTIVTMLVVAVCVLSLAGPMFAQTANGRISGTVKDQTGGAIVGAAVAVTDTARGLTRNLTTDESGSYLAANLIPGGYTVRVAFTGFQAWERTNITLGVAQDLFIDVVLQPGAQTQTVTVTEVLPLVNTTSSTLGGTLNNETIVDLPISGRNYQNLLDLRPGVVMTLGNDSNGGGPASTNGLRSESSNTYTIEGLTGIDPYTGQSVVNNIGVNGDAASLLPVDAIQEFNQQFNAKAEYGWKAGSNVAVGLKSGTNALHGTAYGFFRNDSLDAQNYYTPAGLDVRNNVKQFGGTVGGPIKKDKLFFFLGYEQMLLNVGNPTRIDAPFTDPKMLNCTGSGATYACTPIANSVAGSRTPDASNHIVLACLGVPAAARSPQSLQMLGMDANCQQPGGTSGSGQTFAAGTVNPDFFVDHGGNDHGATANTVFPITSYFPNNDTGVYALGSIAKVDYAMNDKNTVNFFFYKGHGDRKDGLGTQPSNRYRTHFLQYPMMTAGTWTWLPSSAWANTFRVGYATLNQPNIGMDSELGLTAAQLGLNTGVTNELDRGLPRLITLGGFYTLGSRQSDLQGPGRSIEVSDQLNYLRGDHSLRFGATFIADRFEGAQRQNSKGTFTFGRAASGAQQASGVVGFIVGQNAIPATVGGISIRNRDTGLESAALLYGDPFNVSHRNNIALFVQDDWRILPKLTLNLGLRWDVSSVVSTEDSVLGNFDENLGLTQEGIQFDKLYNGDHNNFSPRVGFAWDLFGNGKTVVRGGASTIYELLALRAYFEVGNNLGLAGNPTAWVIGCSVPTTATVPAGATTNCPGTLITSKGTRDVGDIAWSRGASPATLFGNAVNGVNNPLNPVLWDRPSPATTTIYPQAAIHNCSSSIQVKDVVSTTASAGRPGTPCPVGAIDRGFRTPYVETWTLSIQHAIVNNVVLEVGYVGNHGVKLLGKVNPNQAPAGSGWTPALVALCNSSPATGNCDGSSGPSTTLIGNAKPFATKFPYIDVITKSINGDVSNYNGLQVTLTARNYHGFSAVSGYTWSHGLAISDNNNGGLPIDSYQRSLDYGAAGSDLRHRFTLSPTYAIPGRMGLGGLLEGWKLNGNFKYQTGRPLNFSTGSDFQGSGVGTARWDFFGDTSDFTFDRANIDVPGFFAAGSTIPSGINPRTGVAYVAADLAINNPLCTAHAASTGSLNSFGCWVQGASVLTPPAPNTFGNSTRNMFRGLGYWNLDMSVTKRQGITERISAEFRGEVFNIFNHPNVGQPGATPSGGCTIASCAFGRITNTPDVAATNPILGAGGPRRMQLGVKILF